MAITTLTPGVYIDEVSTLPSSVAPVATGIPAFLGYTEKAVLLDGTSALGLPTRIESLLEYEQIFGGPRKEVFNLAIADAGSPIKRTITVSFDGASASPSPYKLYYSLQLYFANGGGPCYILSIGNYVSGTIALADFTSPTLGLDQLQKADEPTLILFPDAVGLPLTGGAPVSYGALVQAALSQCNLLQDRFTISDVPEDSILSANITEFRTAIGQNNLKYGASYMPFLNTVLNYGVNLTSTVIDSYTGTDPNITIGVSLATLQTTYPSLYSSIFVEINKFFVTLPPSGAIAGIYAKVDRERGVWKAPANVGVNGIVGPTINITSAQQENLNVDATTGKSINAIRSFTGKGTLVWGSRTFAGNDNEWRYVPVRRLFIFVEESVKKATEFVVFEPNTANTWQRSQGMIEAFLTGIWRDGALAGATTKDAYFVNVGLGTTMTPQDILEGRMIIEIGMAAVRPAEFIILRFEHKLQE